MRKRVYLPIYFSVLAICLLGATGFFEELGAEQKTIETFEAGPVKGSQKKVYRVKTHFEWNMENPCPCNGENPPCIKTFLNKDLPSTESRTVEEYNNLNENSDRYQGGNYVPKIIRESSVRIIVVPFCPKAKKEDKVSG